MKLKWAILRLGFITISFINLFTLGIFSWLILPFYSKLFFNDYNPTKYIKYLYKIYFTFFKIFLKHLTKPNVREAFTVPLVSAPILSPTDLKLILNPNWQGSRSDCNGCLQCCIKAECPLIDFENKRCKSYGSFFYRYFNCGRFPANKQQITYYECPKWDYRIN